MAESELKDRLTLAIREVVYEKMTTLSSRERVELINEASQAVLDALRAAPEVKAWERVERFADVKVGDRVRLVRPRTVLPPDFDGEDEVIIEEASYEGIATHVNPRGEINLNGHRKSFLSDGVFGDWFYDVYVERADGN